MGRGTMRSMVEGRFELGSPLHRLAAGPSPHRDATGRTGTVTRLRTAKGRKVSSTQWLERQLNDPYVKRAKAEGYRSRAAYKLIELDERFHFLKGAERIVDLGIAPGGGAQGGGQRGAEGGGGGSDLVPTGPVHGGPPV